VSDEPSTGDRILALLYERGERGLTAKEAETTLGLPYSVVRWHLWRLSREGWTVYTPEPTGKRGGPVRRWKIAP